MMQLLYGSAYNNTIYSNRYGYSLHSVIIGVYLNLK